jgi:type II secretory pathway pseudopilin PulG
MSGMGNALRTKYERLRLQSGQALVELLVAISISALMLPGLATAMVASRAGTAQQDKRLQATALLREANEAVRIVRQTGWAGFGVNGTYRPAISGSTWTLTAGAETIGNFTRSIVISDVQRNTTTGAIVSSGGTVDPSTKKVVSTVAWTLPLADSVSTEAYYQRYLGNAAWTQTTQAEFAAGTETNTTATATGGGQLELASAGGGITHVQTAASNNTASSTTIAQAFSSAVKGGSLIVAAISWDTVSSTAVTCSDNQNNTYTTATNANDTTNTQALAICYAPNAAGGSTTVTATFGAASVTRRIIVHEYSGIATTSPVDISRTNIANGTTAVDNVTSTAGTTTTAGDLIFGAVMEDDSGSATITAGTNFTQRNITATELATQDRIQAAAGSIASTQTFGTARRYLAHMVAFKPATTTTAWAPPNIVSSADTAGTEDALDVVVSGTFAYVADATVLRVYDITTITAPVARGTYTAGGTINSLFVSGNFVYLATTNTAGEFVVVNATNKDSLSGTVVNLANTNVGTAIYVANNHAYIGRAVSTTSGQNEFFIYDVTTPASPVARGSLNLTAQVNSIVVPTTTHAYLATSVTSAEVTVVRIDTPTAPTSVGTYDASGTSIGNDIFAVGSAIYLGKANNTSGGELFILTANTANPNAVTFTLVSSPEIGSSINGVAVSGTVAFLATSLTNAQFIAVNITTPASPTTLGSLNLAGVANDITVSGGYAFLATAHDTRELTMVQPSPEVGASGYATSGTLDSSSFDAGASAGYNYITFTITEPASTDVRFQLASNNDNATWNYVGPDGTSGTFYSSAGTVRITTAGRYLRYRATLTGPGTSTPVLSDITINYSP